MVVVRPGVAKIQYRYSNYRVVDWASYGEVLQASSRIMNSISNDVTTLIKTKAIHIPAFVAENARDRKYVLEGCVLA